MQCGIVSSMFFFAVLSFFLALPLYGYGQSLEEESRLLVLQRYGELAERPFILFIVSARTCTGCAAVAVNEAVAELQAENPAIPCVLSVIADNAVEAFALQSKFTTPYIVADTQSSHIHQADRQDTLLPTVVLFDSSGAIVFQQKNIRHSQPNYAAVLRSITWGVNTVAQPIVQRKDSWPMEASQAHRQREEDFFTEGEGLTLEASSTRYTQDISFPVLMGDMLFCYNNFTGEVEAWNSKTGQLQHPIAIPDTVVYFFRERKHKKLWKQIEQQGYDMAPVYGMDATHDTLCLLVQLLAGYTLEDVVQKLPSGVLDTFQRASWYKRDVLVRMAKNGTVYSLDTLPRTPALFDLIAGSKGIIGGVCTDILGESEPHRDSIVFFAAIDMSKGSTVAAVWKTPNTGKVFSAGAKAAAPNGALWYCDPMQAQFFLFQPDGSHTSIELRGTLIESSSPIRFVPPPPDTADGESEPAHSYALDNMVSIGDTLYVLLTPTQHSSGWPCIAQSYTTTGRFLGEWTLHIPLAQGAKWVHLLAVQEGQAVVLLNTPSKRWHIVRVPIAPHQHLGTVPVWQKDTPAR